MSFLNVLKVIGTDALKVVNVASPYASMLSVIPVVGPEISTIFSAIHSVETLVQNSGSGATGPAKKQAVIAIINAIHPGMDQTILSNGIDSIVGVLNTLDSIFGDIQKGVPTK